MACTSFGHHRVMSVRCMCVRVLCSLSHIGIPLAFGAWYVVRYYGRRGEGNSAWSPLYQLHKHTGSDVLSNGTLDPPMPC